MKDYDDFRRIQRQYDEIKRLTEPLARLGIESKMVDLAARIGRETELAHRLAQASQIARFIDPGIGQLAKLNLPETDTAAERLARQMKEQHDLITAAREFNFTRPDLLAIPAMASQAAEILRAHTRYRDEHAWVNELSIRMTTLHTPWAFPDYFDESAFAFGTLARLSDTVLHDPPYGLSTRELVEDELGEVVTANESSDIETRELVYDDAGRDPALVAFPRQYYPAILRGAGFHFVIPDAPTPQPIENVDGPARFDDDGQRALRSLELHLRAFVVTNLSSLSGTRWIKQRVPHEMQQRWERRREDYREAGWPLYELIHYADFNDLAQLMAQTNNWNDAFGAFFSDRDGMRVSLQRLSPLRNNGAHSRPLGPTEMLYEAAEIVRLLRAIGVITSEI